MSVDEDDLDADGDGVVSGSELREWWNQASPSEREAFREKFPEFATRVRESIGSLPRPDEIVGEAVRRVISTVIKPLFTGFWRLSILLVGVVGVVFLGENGKVGLGPGLPGIADLPLILSTALIEATEPVGETVLLTISGFNADIVSALEGAGLAQFPVLVVVQFAELTLVVFVLVRLADLVGLGALLDLVTKPITGLVGRLRG